MWRCFRAWSVARVTARVPAEVWWPEHGRYDSRACPVCGAVLEAPAVSGAGLRHLLGECVELRGLRDACSGAWGPAGYRRALEDTLDLQELAAKCRFVGLAARVWAQYARGQAGGGGGARASSA